MRSRNHRQEPPRSLDKIEWPDSQLEVDDEAFARAIAEGRDEELAA